MKLKYVKKPKINRKKMLPKLSLGTYSILKQLELAKRWGMRHLYLGLYIEANEHMAYKARFLPHDRLVRGEWRKFEREPAD